MNIEYYYSVASPYAYLGSKKFRTIVENYSLKVKAVSYTHLTLPTTPYV